MKHDWYAVIVMCLLVLLYLWENFRAWYTKNLYEKERVKVDNLEAQCREYNKQLVVLKKTLSTLNDQVRHYRSKLTEAIKVLEGADEQ